jgi:glycosyltransferase involved in cell wall biosynthesis
VEELTGERRPGVVAYPGGQFQPEISGDEIIARACQPGPLKVLFVGNLIPRKGLHTLIAAMEHLHSGAVALTVTGGALADSRYGRAISAQIAASRNASAIYLTGPLPAERLGDLMRAQHVIAVPSSYEGYGIVYLEGMGFGLPAIASTGGAAGEIINHGEDGFLVPPGDPAALASAIAQLFGDRQKLAAMGIAARLRYEQHPGWEQAGEAIRDFIHNVCK